MSSYGVVICMLIKTYVDRNFIYGHQTVFCFYEKKF